MHWIQGIVFSVLRDAPVCDHHIYVEVIIVNLPKLLQRHNQFLTKDSNLGDVQAKVAGRAILLPKRVQDPPSKQPFDVVNA